MDYIRRNKFTYTQIIDGDKIAEIYKVAALPTFFVIDQSGTIVLRHRGFKENLESDLIGVIETLIKAPRSQEELPL